MKKFILGFILAAVLFSAFPVAATIQQYILTPSTTKIVVDGIEVKDNKLPIMAYEGYNYIPAATFKSICDKISIGFKWDEAVKEIRVATFFPTAHKVNLTKWGYIPVEFNKNIVTCENSSRIELKDEDGVQIAIKKSVPGNTDKRCLCIIPTYNLNLNKDYTLFIPANTVKSEAGDIYSENITFKFKYTGDW